MFDEIGRKSESNKHGSERKSNHLRFKTVNRSLLGVGLRSNHPKNAFGEGGGGLKTLVES